jgi:small subunit ribosomal protein S1
MKSASTSSPKKTQAAESPASGAKPDLSSLGSMLQARWKGGQSAEGAKPDPVQSGQIRKFKITKLDASTKKIEVELA